MTKIKIPNKASRAVHKALLTCKKHSPEVLVVAGVVGVVTSTVLACRATVKAGAVVEEVKKYKRNLDIAATAAGLKEANEDFTEEELEIVAEAAKRKEIQEMTEEDIRKDTAMVYGKAALKFAKLYGPSVVLGALSITGILTSHRILSKRNVALASAYAIVDRGFKDYRGRVIDRFGKELDRELRFNVRPEKIQETVVDEKGEEEVKETVVNIADYPAYSEYARIFDETCLGWTKDAEYNRMFLLNMQRQANDKLQHQGYLTLNQVYEMLGFDKTGYGQVVGWVYDKTMPIGDNYVDFGIFQNVMHPDNEAKRLFINGKERSVILDFNVDGNILDYII